MFVTRFMQRRFLVRAIVGGALAALVGCGGAAPKPFTEKEIEQAEKNFIFKDGNPEEGTVSGDVRFTVPASVKLSKAVTHLQAYMLDEPVSEPRLSGLLGEAEAKDFTEGVVANIPESRVLDQKIYLYLKNDKLEKNNTVYSGVSTSIKDYVEVQESSTAEATVASVAGISALSVDQAADASESFDFVDENLNEGVINGIVTYIPPDSVSLGDAVTHYQVHLLDAGESPSTNSLVGETAVEGFTGGSLGALPDTYDQGKNLYLYLKDESSGDVVFSGVSHVIADNVQSELQAASEATTASGDAVVDSGTVNLDFVHFEFDRYELSIRYQQILDDEIAVLGDVESMDFLVAGHADERGTEEYNQQLGDRRANAVREYLELIGVPAENITTISYGESRPYDTASDQAAWALNRRVEIEATPF